MDENNLRIDLLRLVCAALPATEARSISELDPHDPDTHVAAYAAVVRTETVLPPELHRSFYAQFAGAGFHVDQEVSR